jgi:hypothetical protein
MERKTLTVERQPNIGLSICNRFQQSISEIGFTSHHRSGVACCQWLVQARTPHLAWLRPSMSWRTRKCWAFNQLAADGLVRHASAHTKRLLWPTPLRLRPNRCEWRFVAQTGVPGDP